MTTETGTVRDWAIEAAGFLRALATQKLSLYWTTQQMQDACTELADQIELACGMMEDSEEDQSGTP